jgi:uncharacterized protein (DUF433 family)
MEAMGIRERVQNLHAVSNNPDVLHGQTVFAGTRVPLDTMLAYREDGCSMEEYLEDYPTVQRWQAELVWDMPASDLLQLIERGASTSR